MILQYANSAMDQTYEYFRFKFTKKNGYITVYSITTIFSCVVNKLQFC